jgi:hypothetical protein
VQSGRTCTRPARSTPTRAALGDHGSQRRRLDAGCPDLGRRLDPPDARILGVRVDTALVHPGDHRAEVDLDPHPLELAHRAALQRLGERVQARRVRVEQHDSRLRGIDPAEVALQRAARELHDPARELDPGGAGADDHERQPDRPQARIRLALGHLEVAEDPAAQLERIVDGLHPRRVARELRVPEVGLAGPRREDQAVIADLAEQAERVDGEAAAPRSIASTSPNITLRFAWWRRMSRIGGGDVPWARMPVAI